MANPWPSGTSLSLQAKYRFPPKNTHPMPHYWLMKSEPSEVSVDDALAAPNATVAWTGVRNYQARNFMRDAMQVGDGVLFYHSSCQEPGIVGVARVASGAYIDPTQFAVDSPYFDPASKVDAPRWLLVDVQVLHKTRNFTLAELRSVAELADLLVLKRGNRLSITPVEPHHWQVILQRLGVNPDRRA
jgi:predicted RNA-binding protein with PUA-like domain